MALSHVFANMASSDIVGRKEVVADEVYQSNPQASLIYTLIAANGIDKLPTDSTYVYGEIDQRVNRTTLNGAIAGGDTTITMTDACFSAAQQVRINGELILLGTTSDNLTFSTCTRSVGEVAAATQADGDMVAGLPVPRAQGRAAGSTGDHVVMPSQVTTYPQIFGKDIVVSGTAQAIAAYGNVNSVDRIVSDQELALKLEAAQAFLYGKSQAPSGTGTAGRFDGLVQRLQVAGQTDDIGGANVVQNDLEGMIQGIRDYNYMPDTLICGLRSERVFNSWNLPHVTIPNMSAQMYGVTVPQVNLGGSILNVLATPEMDAEMIICDSSKLQFGWMPGRELSLTYMGVEGDRVKAMLNGEGVCAFPCPASANMLTSVNWAA